MLKQSLSKSGFKADLRKRLKLAIVDEIPIADVEKTSVGSEEFDWGYRWRLLEPSNAVIGPQCKDHKLLDPSSPKYVDENGIGNEKKVIKMSYATKFAHKKIAGEALQPKKCLSLSKINKS